MRLSLALLALASMVSSAGVRVLSSSNRAVTLRYEPGELRLADEAGGAVLSFPDADHLAGPGEWDLPCRVVRIGIPQSGGISVSTTYGEMEEASGVHPAVVPSFSWESESAWVAEPELDHPVVPEQLVSTGPVETMRRVRFVTLKFHPVQYEPEHQRLRWYRFIDARVTFEHEPVVVDEEDVLDGWVASALANGGTAKDWKIGAPARSFSQFARAAQWLKVKVAATGLYRITGAELAAAGVPISGLTGDAFAMYTLGEHVPCSRYPDSMTSVPLMVTGDADGRFDRGDTIMFYALAPEHWVGACSAYTDNFYTDNSVYWLSWTAGAGRRVRAGLQPETVGTEIRRTGRDVLHQEPDLDCPARSGLLWIWKSVYKSSEQTSAGFDAHLDLNYPQQIRRVSGRLLATKPGNLLTVSFNRRQLATFTFNQALPSAPFTFSIDTVLPCDYVGNRLRMDLGGTGEKQLYVDYLEIEYDRRLSLSAGQLHFLADDTGRFRFTVRDVPSQPIVLDVTDPYSPVRIDGFADYGDSITFCHRLRSTRRMLVAGRSQLLGAEALEPRTPGRLADPLVQADHWIVTPREFLPAAAEYARYRTGNIAGISRARSQAAVLDEIYDDYCFGFEEPWAVKRFFADKQPAYGLLVGDATYDYRNRLGAVKPPGIPAYEVGQGLDPDGTQDRSALAIDAAYADFEGEGGSPDMALGRITARSAAELRRFLEKIRLYENGPAGTWTRRYLLMADDEFMGDPGNPRKWDPIGFGHVEYCEAVSVMPGDVLDPIRIYLTEYPYAQVKNKPGANAELLRQLDLGGVLWVFFGHGAAHDLTHESVLSITTVPEIRNGGRVPFCFFGSCSVGRFDDTKFESISEELVRMNGGAIATLGATKSTAAGSNLVYARNLLTPLFTYPESTIGYSFFQASPTDRTYHLFGDPATVLRMPRTSAQSPYVTPDTLRPGATFTWRGLLEMEDGEFMWSLAGPLRSRSYSSMRGTTTYLMQGLEAARGSGRVRDGRFYCGGVFPLGLPLDTVFVSNGYYAPVTKSCRLTASVWNDSANLSVVADTIAFAAQAATSDDSAGPTVVLSSGGRPLRDGMTVDADLQLDGVLSDPSGILIAPVPGSTPELYVNQRTRAFDLADLLVFDESLFTAARFRVPLRLHGPVDSICVLVSDNLLNRTESRVLLSSGAADLLRVDSLLVYPNPVRHDATFCCRVTRSATVRVRVFSLSGRLVRDLGEHVMEPGFGRVPWEGTDRSGNPVPNGVYLVALRATCREADGAVRSVLARERFLVMR